MPWENFDGVLVRVAAWGYIHRPEKFLDWTQALESSSTLVSPARVLRWNHDKVYLQELAAAGLPIVDTAFVQVGDSWSWSPGEFVVKPTRAAGGFETARYGPADHEQAGTHIHRLHQMGQTAMVQPYVRDIEPLGETSLVFIGEELSHAVHKLSLLRPDAGVVDRLWEQERLELTEASAEQARLGRVTLEAVHGEAGETAYARVDLVPGPGATSLIGEVELIDPSLFFDLKPEAAARFTRELRLLADRS